MLLDGPVMRRYDLCLSFPPTNHSTRAVWLAIVLFGSSATTTAGVGVVPGDRRRCVKGDVKKGRGEKTRR